MSIGIRFVSIYRPTNTIDNIVQASLWDIEQDFIRNKIVNLHFSSPENQIDS